MGYKQPSRLPQYGTKSVLLSKPPTPAWDQAGAGGQPEPHLSWACFICSLLLSLLFSREHSFINQLHTILVSGSASTQSAQRPSPPCFHCGGSLTWALGVHAEFLSMLVLRIPLSSVETAPGDQNTFITLDFGSLPSLPHLLLHAPAAWELLQSPPSPKPST